MNGKNGAISRMAGRRRAMAAMTVSEEVRDEDTQQDVLRTHEAGEIQERFTVVAKGLQLYRRHQREQEDRNQQDEEDAADDEFDDVEHQHEPEFSGLQPVPAHRLPESEDPAPHLPGVVLQVVRILGVGNGGRGVERDPPQLSWHGSQRSC